MTIIIMIIMLIDIVSINNIGDIFMIVEDNSVSGIMNI